MLHAGAHGRPDSALDHARHAARKAWTAHDSAQSAQAITPFSQKDAAKYLEFEQSLGKIGKVISDALATTAPDIDHPSTGDMWSMLKTGRAIRKLGKKDMFRLLRWGPM